MVGMGQSRRRALLGGEGGKREVKQGGSWEHCLLTHFLCPSLSPDLYQQNSWHRPKKTHCSSRGLLQGKGQVFPYFKDASGFPLCPIVAQDASGYSMCPISGGRQVRIGL